MRALLVVAFLSVPAFADDLKVLDPFELKTGEAGTLLISTKSGGYTYRVVDVIDKGKVLVSATGYVLESGGTREGKPISLLLSVDTTDLVDGKIYMPKGVFKVTGTEKIKGRTVFALKQQPKD